MEKQTKDGHRIRGLDGLRGIAVTLAFLHHKTPAGQFNVGSYGMWLFYLLSGFLIIQILHDARKDIESGDSNFPQELRIFMTRRILRIFPVYYVFLVLTLPLYSRIWTEDGVPLHLGEAWFNFLYLSNVWIANVHGHWVGPLSHLWSLSVEEQFYLFAPLAFLLTPSRHAVKVCLALIILGVSVRAWLEWEGAPPISIYTNSFINFALIAYGGACAIGMKTLPPVLQRTAAVAAPLLLAIYLGMPFMLLAAGIYPGSEQTFQYPAVLAGPMLAFIAADQRQWLVRLLELWPLRSLGQISYGFYLFHNLSDYFIRGLQHLLSKAAGEAVVLGPWTNLILSFAATVAVAALSWRYFEKPLLRLRPRRAGKQAQQSSAGLPELVK